MEVFVLEMRQGFNPDTSAASCRRGVRQAFILLLAVALLFGLPAISLSQQPQQPSPVKQDSPRGAAGAITKPKPKAEWRVRVNSEQEIPFISIRAKDAPLTDVAAELQRQLKVPIILGKLLKRQSLTVDFKDLSLEMALRTVALNVLAPLPTIDYKINGGGGAVLARKEPIAIYLTAYNELPPGLGPYSSNESAGFMVSGFIPETPEEEKAMEEKKKQDLQVSFEDDIFKIKAKDQPLTDVIEMMAAKLKIPFAILTNDTAQKEFDQVVNWDIANSTLEDIAITWFPDAVRLYLRTDLETNSTRPLRITLERPSEARTQQQNDKP